MYKYFSLQLIIFGTIFVFLFSSCSNQPSKISHNVQNLEKKFSLLTVKNNNKNDIIKILGDTLIKEYPDEKVWVYIETEGKNNFFGKKTIVKNNVLILEFNSKGILESKKIIDIKKLTNLKLEEMRTESFAINESFSRKFFSSLRKRIENKTNSQANK